MKQIKHSKFRNTGFLFELLVRQVTSDILNNRKGIAEGLLKKYFNSKTELSNELKLYQFIVSEKYNSENRAEKFVDAVIDSRAKLDEKKILKEKYNLIKEIKDNYSIDEFLRSQIPNYKVLASVYKIFEYKVNIDQNYDPKDFINTKYALVEHLTGKAINTKAITESTIETQLKKEDEEIRLLTYNVLIENFNKKYTNLNEQQKGLLKEYINSFTNSDNLKKYVVNEVKVLVKDFKQIGTKITDKVTKIKLAETINQLSKIVSSSKIKDNHITSLIMCYELQKELKDVKSTIRRTTI
jgi:hypothetical protein